MRVVNRWTLGFVFLVALAVSAAADSGHGRRFEITDDCDPNDPAWAPTGGCLTDGQVTNAEFNAALPQGHPSWRIEPPYVQDRRQDSIKVRNTGGRGHTFTEVARFGNGFVPPLNAARVVPPGATFTAPECVAPTGGPSPQAQATTLAPGQELEVNNLQPGTHNFQCCIHPWMRTVVKIAERGDRGRD
jgi:plastocyanin